MELKRCTKCGENKPNTNEYFAFSNKSKGTLRPSCKVCDKKYRENNKDKIKEYHKKNKVKILEYAKEYRENNKVKIKEYYENNKDRLKELKKAYMKEYNEKNKDRLREYNKEYNKEYREKNKDKLKKSKKEYYENNKDKLKERNKEYYKEYRERNKDKLKERNKEYMKEYRERNKDKLKERDKRYRHKKRGNGGSYTQLQWLDTLEYFDYKCAYTGECIKHGCHVEHIVPVSKGGTSYIWNLVPSTASANLSKHNRDMEEWYREQEYFCEERLNKIYEYQKYMAAKYK